ncbi:hypothetical protein GW915_12290, partial [bacterium]|nr:hypothetical protein [bacterium]
MPVTIDGINDLYVQDDIEVGGSLYISGSTTTTATSTSYDLVVQDSTTLGTGSGSSGWLNNLAIRLGTGNLDLTYDDDTTAKNILDFDNSTDAISMGNVAATLAISSSDWNITVDGVMTGIDSITSDAGEPLGLTGQTGINGTATTGNVSFLATAGNFTINTDDVVVDADGNITLKPYADFIISDGTNNDFTVGTNGLVSILSSIASRTPTRATAEGDLFIENILETAGAAYFDGTVEINSTLTLASDETITNAVDGNIVFTDSATSQTLTFDLNGANITLSPSTGLVIDSGGSLVVQDATTINGNLDATSGVDVTGANLTVGGSNFTVNVANGNTTSTGTLNYSGAGNNLFAGNVGIGTTDPTALFEVNGALKATTINGNTITTGTGTLTLGAGKTLTVSDSTTLNTNSITLGGGEVITFSASNALSLLTTGTTSVTLPTSGTLYGTKTDSITSSQLLTSLSDETGTGVAVFGTAPTFTTSITDPLVIGGTTTTSTLALRSTSGVGTTGADILFQVGNNGATEAMRILNNGNVGIGTTDPGAYKLNVNGNTNITGNLNVTADIESLTGTITTLDGATLTYTTGNLTTLDLGTNTITDGTLTGNWGFSSGNLSSVGTIGSGAITSTGAVQGTSLTDGTATLTSGAFTGLTGITSSGTITFSGLGTGVVQSSSGGVLSNNLGTANYLTKWNASGITNANIYDNAGNVGIGGTAPATVPSLYVGANGNVGIGTTDPGTYALNVTGTGYFGGALTLGTQATTTAQAVRADRSLTLTSDTNVTITNSGSAQDLTTDKSWTLGWNGLLSLARGGTGVGTTNPSNGTLLIGNGTGYTVASLTGTTNQVNVTNGTGTITLSTPQDIATSSSPVFAGLGIGATNPSYLLNVVGSANLTSGNAYYINGASVLNATTLGSGVLASSLTSTGALTGGSIASGFGTISTANTISTSSNISSTGSGTITSAGLLTASNGFTLSSGALNMTSTSGALAITGLSASTLTTTSANLTL